MNFKNNTTEKLYAELKGLKVITGALTGLLSVLFVVILFGLLTKEENKIFVALIAIPIALSTMIPINYRNIKKIKKELEVREKLDN